MFIRYICINATNMLLQKKNPLVIQPHTRNVEGMLASIPHTTSIISTGKHIQLWTHGKNNEQNNKNEKKKNEGIKKTQLIHIQNTKNKSSFHK